MKKKILASTLAICLAFGSAAYLPAGTLTDSTTIKASAGRYRRRVEWLSVSIRYG